MNRPAMDCSVIDRDASFSHHLLKITKAEAVGEIPPHAKQDHRAIKMTAFENRLPPEVAGGVDRTELPTSLRQIQNSSPNGGYFCVAVEICGRDQRCLFGL